MPTSWAYDKMKEVQSSQRLTDLGNEISDAINRALKRGLQVDEACSVAVKVAADYWRGKYGPKDLSGLASIVTNAAKMSMPSDVSRQ